MRLLVGVLVALVACSDAGPRDPVRRIEITPDSAAFAVGDSVAFVAKAFDAAGSEIDTENIGWATNASTLTVNDNGVAKALGPIRGRVIARNTQDVNVMAEAAVWAQERATFIRVGFSAAALVVAPGATFLTDPGAWNIDNGNVAYVDYGSLYAKSWGVLGSSNAAAADWVKFEDLYKGSYNRGWTISTFAAGEAYLRIASNGLRDSVKIVVRNPQFGSEIAPGVACALTSSGEAWCRGDNGAGQLGTLTAPWRLCCGSVSGEHQQGSDVWVGVDTDKRFRSLVSGSKFTCGLTDTDALYCWGGNNSGSLGVATSDSLVRTIAGEPRCSVVWSFTDPSYNKCHFRPIRVDRDLGQVLNFDEVRVLGTQLCAHAIRRGASEPALASVDEIWCWGGSYGTPPTQRPGFFQ